MKFLMGLISAVVSVSALAAEVASTMTINVTGMINVARKKTCAFDLGAGADGVTFDYVKNRIPNYYFLWQNVASYDQAKTGTYNRYFKPLDYKVNCNFKPVDTDLLSVGYSVSGGVAVAGRSTILRNYLESSQGQNGGFLVFLRSASSLVDFKEVITDARVYPIPVAEFVPQGDGSYTAMLNYMVGFAGLNLNQIDLSGEFVDQNLVSVGNYTRDITLNVSYN